MENLTAQQKAIVDAIVGEFTKINSPAPDPLRMNDLSQALAARQSFLQDTQAAESAFKAILEQMIVADMELLAKQLVDYPVSVERTSNLIFVKATGGHQTFVLEYHVSREFERPYAGAKEEYVPKGVAVTYRQSHKLFVKASSIEELFQVPEFWAEWLSFITSVTSKSN